MDHDIVVPAERLAAVGEAFFNLTQFPHGQHPVGQVAPGVGLRRRVREAELVAGDAGRGFFDLLGPFLARIAIEHVAWMRVVVEHIDRQRIPADERRFDRLDLLLHAHSRTAVGLADAVEAVCGDDFHQGVAARSLEHYDFDIANLLTTFLGLVQNLEFCRHGFFLGDRCGAVMGAQRAFGPHLRIAVTIL